MDLLPAEEEEGGLSLGSLILVDQDLQPYILEWLAEEDEPEHLEFFALAVMRRQDGVLLAVPFGSMRQEDLDLGNQGDLNTVVGLSTVIEVPTVVLDGGALHPTGTSVQCFLVDFSVEVLSMMRLPAALSEVAFNFDLETPLALPDPKALIDAATEWIRGAEEGPLAFYTAESAAELIEEGDFEEEAEGISPRRRKALREPKPKAGPAHATPGAKPPGKAEKPKRVTTASLASSMDQILQTLPALTSQVQDLVVKQNKMERQMASGSLASSHALAQPLSRSVMGQSLAPSALAKQLQSPPRTGVSKSLGLLPSQLTSQPPELAALEREKPSYQQLPQGDRLAQAVLAQSQALTTLVGQIAQSSSDPMTDLSGTFGTGTRGSSGRIKLQT